MTLFKNWVLICFVFGGVVFITACNDDEGSDNEGSAGDADTDTDTDSDSDSDVDFTCAADETNVVLSVTANPDGEYIPWDLWPDDADGIGNLVVVLGFTPVEKVLNVDFSEPDANYTVTFCAKAGDSKITVFLDDDEDAQEDARNSSDYLDTCMGTNDECFRCVNSQFVAGQNTLVSAVLEGSCD